MKAKELSLSHFRNIKEAVIRFSPGVTFLLGDNAQGKTNVMEAIYLFARGKSFRSATDREMTAFGEEGYCLSLLYEKEKREERLSVFVSGKEKERRKNGVLLEKRSELIGNFRAVLFSPDHLQMVKGAPSERRHFLDVAISQCYPVYLSLYSRYQKNLEERNALLKAMQKGFFYEEEMLSVYSESLASLSAEIYLYRREYVKRLKEKAKAIVSDLSSQRESLSLVYRSDIDSMEGDEADRESVRQAYRRVFFENTQKERLQGVTLFGIHRDDLLMNLNGIPAKEFGSQGQQRSTVLALKMAEGMLSGEICGEMPVYLFDDVLSELDEGRRKYLLSGMKGCQFIVSGCDRDNLKEISDDVGVICVKNGTFEKMPSRGY